jgi:hypothetical protein
VTPGFRVLVLLNRVPGMRHHSGAVCCMILDQPDAPLSCMQLSLSILIASSLASWYGAFGAWYEELPSRSTWVINDMAPLVKSARE